MLSEEEIAEVWGQYLKTRDVDCLDLIVRQYQPLAAFFARRAIAKAPAFQDPEELLSYAHDGLIKSIKAFDPNAGAKFETYASRRIPGAIIDGQRSQDPLARGTRKKVKELEAAYNELWDQIQCEPSTEALAEKLGTTPDDVRATLLAQKSLNSTLDDGSVDTNGRWDEAEVLTQVAEVRRAVASKLAILSLRERVFVLRFYGDGANLKETGETLGIGSEWCRKTRSGIHNALAG